METNKSIARPGYLLAAMLFLLPLGDVLTAAYPFRLGEERWRFGMVGSLGSIALLPLTGLFVALVIATTLDHRRIRRALGWACLVFAIIFGVSIVIFMLDFFQVRGMMSPLGQQKLGVEATKVVIKQVLTVLALVLFSRLGMSGRGKSLIREAPLEETSTATPLLTRPGAVRAE